MSPAYSPITHNAEEVQAQPAGSMGVFLAYIYTDFFPFVAECTAYYCAGCAKISNPRPVTFGSGSDHHQIAP